MLETWTSKYNFFEALGVRLTALTALPPSEALKKKEYLAGNSWRKKY
jgi:hypothetical protein